jgi:hypothetical protein
MVPLTRRLRQLMPRRSHTHKHAHAPRTPPNQRRCARHVYDALAGGLNYLDFYFYTVFSIWPPPLCGWGHVAPPLGGATRPQGRPLPLPRPPLGPPFAPPPIPRPPLAPPPLPRPCSACAARRPWAILARFPMCCWYAAIAAVSAYKKFGGFDEGCAK